jgi:putative membrane-bound dehydrogenase-like protein
MRWTRLATLPLFSCLYLLGAFADTKPGDAPKGPLSPREELATFKVPKGFRVELVASEPDVIDPVCMAFDEDGRLFVAEMPGYPNGGIGSGKITSGRIKVLEDPDGDGKFTQSRVYADGLRFPTGMQPWRNGLLVAVAPDIVYLEESKGSSKADKTHRLYTDFNLANIQQLVNSLQWGMDNWVHGVAGSDGGTIRSVENKDALPITLRNRGIRFHPETPGSLEPTSGGGQYGLAPDDWGRWFTATNSQHLRHIVLPDHYLRRNPSLAVRAVTLDIPDHGAACKVHRISPFEAWRVERTTRRREGPDANRFPTTELVPGGFITSACSPVIYTARAFPKEYQGTVFVCDPANNIVHRDVLKPNGASFIAGRGEAECEFLASTDTWFRPVWLSVGPDGALYVLDFYREVIETPLSLPDDIKKKLNLESRKRGRIWRVVAENAPRYRKPSLRKASVEKLVECLADDNRWWRITAQRLLVERQDKDAIKLLEQLAREGKSGVARAHALWTLQGLLALSEKQIVAALKDTETGVREQALQLAEEHLTKSKALQTAVAAMVQEKDLDGRVAFQLALTLGSLEGVSGAQALGQLARRPGNDGWTQTAILSSAGRSGARLLEELAVDREFIKAPTTAQLETLTALASLVGVKADDAEMTAALNLVGGSKTAAPWQAAILEGLGQGMQNGGRSLPLLWDKPTAGLKDVVDKVRPLFNQASATALDEKKSLVERIAGVRLLGYGPFRIVADASAELLKPQSPPELQMSAVRSLAPHTQAKVAELLLAAWDGFSPTVRREALEVLLARRERVEQLLAAMEKKKVLAGQLEPVRLLQLKRLTDPKLRERANAILKDMAAPDRLKIIDEYKTALDLKPDIDRGKAVFRKNCITCHRLDGAGVEVGPDLVSALRNKSTDQLLTDILDPSREVDPRYLNYLVYTTNGRSFTGMIAADTASSITLRRAEKAEDTILRTQIDSIQSTGKSVMPDGLEKQVNKQEMADLIAYLKAASTPK